MLRAITNFWFRSQDPTRDWVADASQVRVDVGLCTLCGVPLGGDFSSLAGRGLGPSEDARRSVQGLPDWSSSGLYCTVDGGRICDFTLLFACEGRTSPFKGSLLHRTHALGALTDRTTPEDIVRLLGEPFAKSKADGDNVLFYEYPAGEVQFAFGKNRGLDSVEFLHEPELSNQDARACYGIDKAFPPALRRSFQRTS